MKLSDKLSKDFRFIEAQSKDGAEMPEHIIVNVKRHARNLQKIRNEIGAPLTVNSWYRSESHNEKVGGSENSWHLTGLATDLSCKRKKPIEIYGVIMKLINSGQIKPGGVKMYQTFVHYDSRGVIASW